MHLLPAPGDDTPRVLPVRDDDPAPSVSSRTSADVCVRRQIISAGRRATRRKHGPLDDAVLSPVETQVLLLHLDGRSQAELAAHPARSPEAVDDALQRIERTLEGHLRARALADAG